MHLSIDVQWQCCLRVQSRERCSTAMLYRLTSVCNAQLRAEPAQAAQLGLLSFASVLQALAPQRETLQATDKHP